MSLTPRERERLDALVGAYKRLPKAEPSAELDAAVLANARAAVAKRGRPRWPGLLATAATLTVAVGLTWQLRTADRRVESELPQVVAPAPQATPPPAGTDDGALRDAAGDTALAKKPAPQTAEPALPRTAPAGTAGAGPARDPISEPKAVAEPFPGEERKTEAPPADAAFGEEREQARPAVATPAEPAPILEEAPVRELEEQLESMPAPPPPAPASAPAPAIESSSAATTAADDHRKAAEIVTQPRPAQAAAPPARDEAPEAITVTGTRRRATSESAQSRADSGANAALGAAVAVREPRAWLDDIERLLRDGRREEALAELERFREAYPDHELPRALRDLKP